MAHFNVLVVGDNVARQMASYDEGLPAPPYKVRVRPDDLQVCQRMGAIFGRAPHVLELDTEALAATDPMFLVHWLAEWTGCKAGVDMNGLYYLSNANPRGEWDWYSLKGPRTQRLTLKDGGPRVTSARKGDLFQPIRPAFLTVLKAGCWHRIPYSRFWQDVALESPPDSEEDALVLEEFDALLIDVPDDVTLTVVDCHTLA
jgi:hypothetical protein